MHATHSAHHTITGLVGRSRRRLPVGLIAALVALAMLAPAALACDAAATARPAEATAPSYARDHFDLQTLPWRALMYNGPHLSRSQPNPPVDGRGIPLRAWFGHLYYVADRIARQGLYRLNGYVRSGDSAYTPVLRAFDAKLRALARSVGDAWFFPWPFSYRAEHLRAPWYNAMTQGLVLSFFVRMYEVYGDPSDLEAAGHTFRSFLTRGPRSGPWVTTVERGYLWLEHYPGGMARHVLNAHMWAIFGLHEYWQRLADLGSAATSGVRTVLEGAITTMRHNVWRYRRPGRLSLYSLTSGTAYVHYHLLHIRQLRLLARMSGSTYFSWMADKFYADYH